MIAEIGHLSLWLALVFALVQGVAPMLGVRSTNQGWLLLARPTAWMQWFCLSIGLLALGYAFVENDFTIRYVSEHSNSLLPIGYRISAIWGGHEGSLLLWVWMLSLWGLLVSVLRGNVPLQMNSLVLSVMGLVGVGFLLFMLLTSNPFDRLLPWFPLDGADLNPLLQDPGLIIHPPMLYMGYVGFSVAFAFAIAGLISGNLDPTWARWARPWTTVAWCFLTVGIALGSWWAYYELGWGGWWFWDPVENASFMPWLCGTALIHSLAVAEKRGLFRSWTVFLAILAFSLSLLGTFLVRSGVLTSVHAFANDPERGRFILGFLAVVVGGSFSLFAVRAPTLRAQTGFAWLSRESFLLMNNLILLVAAFVVLLGTLFPLIGEWLDIKVSVRSPYFNAFFVPLTLLLMAVLVPGMLSNWKRQQGDVLVRKLMWLVPVSIVIGSGLVWLAGELPFAGWLAICLCVYVWLMHAADIVMKARAFRQGTLRGLRRLTAGYFGMVVAHCGMALLVAGVTLVSFQHKEHDVRMSPGEVTEVGGYEFAFTELVDHDGPNYKAKRAVFNVSRHGEPVAVMLPEKRNYLSGGQIMTEAAIDPGLMRDLYVALGEPLDDTAWAVRIYYKPGVRWLWLGALIMAIGGALAISDKRYRAKKKIAQEDAEHATA
ncbi:MAG: heme lyase CcmF/NrfE family subunit [Alcanivoracaceae bacterium]|nr:heme lyase CcmF/NrfE family subunit [Alcanivoracaceae bacterium]